MNKYILALIIVFIPFIVFAQSETIRGQAIQNDTTVKVKILIDKREIEENNYRKPTYFYTNLTASVNDEIVFNISMGPYISNDGIFRFEFENTMNAKAIQFYITDNKGKQKTASVPIVASQKPNKSNISFNTLKPITYTIKNHYREDNADVWKAKTPDEAMKNLYGSVHFIKEKIQIITPKLSGNNISHPVTIKSDIRLESIAVMLDTYENPTIAIYSLPPTDNTEYFLRIVLPTEPTSMNLIVVGKGLDGKIYGSTQEIEVSVCSGT
jgi:sulfur-oxidizing protein SoxY